MKAIHRSGLRDQRLKAGETEPAFPEVLVAAEASQELPHNGIKISANSSAYNCGSPLDKHGLCEAMASSCGDSEGHVSDTACPSQAQVSGCPELLHELSNLMTGVLLNAQMLEWKLPPYSHLKRPVKEVARNAQRATELMKRLQQRFLENGRAAHANHASEAAIENREIPSPWPGAGPAHTSALLLEQLSAQSAVDLTTACDSCTSAVFPKKE